MAQIKIVYCQRWTESERGWGQRPDGYSLYVDKKEAKRGIDKLYEGRTNYVPDCYTSPTGDLYGCQVDDKTYDAVQKNKTVFVSDNNYPERL